MPPVPQIESRSQDSQGLAGLTRSSFRSDLKPFLKEWIRLNWRDLLVMCFVAELSFFIYSAPITILRTFPITFGGSGDIIYPEWAYPDRGWILPSWEAGLISIGVPILVYVVAQLRIRSVWDASNAIMGSTWGLLLGTLFQVVLKQLIGGFRPYFLDVCMPNVSLAETRNKTGLNGVGFLKVMYTTEICTQPHKSKLQNAVTSFPSGHSTAAFAGFVFLFLWLNAKLKVWGDFRPAFWKLVLTMLPLLMAATIAGSLTIDAAHNWYDIVGGSMIGTVMAVASYRSSYAAIFDWRFNHVPLRARESFAYDADQARGPPAETMTGRAQWGQSRRWLDEQSAGASSRNAFFSHYPGETRRGNAGKAPAEGGRADEGPGVGDEAV
ncbi:hypothetical protein E4U42_003683 [Claviceps africana]|uniref:Phosphatidic acid phosphatase type 2/haloperoxidase domain-containing protein n=1 Tax=Claviceps africana TaxID=83212 RepID=A0A8K0J7I0_9HYPO|nr:hypothetical protein E4U42_003683 [Claviceps africana]